jgi:hypothetical protein
MIREGQNLVTGHVTRTPSAGPRNQSSRDRGCRPRRRTGPRSKRADPPCRRGPEPHRPAGTSRGTGRRLSPRAPSPGAASKSSSRDRGWRRGVCTTSAGALAPSGTWRSMFTRVRASPRSITTASSHVVHVQRSLPSPARSTVTFPARAKAAPSPSRRVAPRRERMRSTSRSFDPLEVILPQVRGGRGSFYNRGRFCSQCVYLSLDVHESQGLAF